MRAASPQQSTEAVDVFRRRLLLEELPAPARPARPGLQVLVDGFLHGSLLTLAVCTPERQSLLSGAPTKRREVFRAFLVSRPSAEAKPEGSVRKPIAAH